MPLRNQRKKPWCKLGFTTVQEAEESQQRPEITQLRIVGREDFSPCLLEILARQTYLNCRSCHIQFIGIALHQWDPLGNAGQTHLNSDAKIADEGRPQGGEGTHKGCPLPSFIGQETGLQSPKTYGICDSALRSAQFQALCPGEGTHKGRPYQFSSLGVMPWGGHPQGAPLPILFSRRYALGRAPTRGAPTNCLVRALCLEKGAHKGSPYQLSSPGVMLREGHPQGEPLPVVITGRYALGRAPTRGAPTHCLLWALCLEKGTHKGRPYQLSCPGVMLREGHPQGVPLPVVITGRYA